jgi:hypothetical protein
LAVAARQFTVGASSVAAVALPSAVNFVAADFVEHSWLPPKVRRAAIAARQSAVKLVCRTA